jgi:hypothetical protein
VLFTGEMVFPWMFQDFAYLQPFKEAADLLADKQDWPALYSSDTLQQNKVRVAAVSEHWGWGAMHNCVPHRLVQLEPLSVQCVPKVY